MTADKLVEAYGIMWWMYLTVFVSATRVGLCVFAVSWLIKPCAECVNA